MLNNIRGKRILVIGDVMLDEYICGRVLRMSPEAPVPILSVDSVSYAPGGAANVAVNIAALGAEPTLIGVVGDDAFGRLLRVALLQCGVDTAHLIVDGTRITTGKTRVIAQRHQLLRIDREVYNSVGSWVWDKIATGIMRCEYDGVILSDYNKGVVTQDIAVRIIDRFAGIPVVVDPKATKFGKYRWATLLTPNETEASQASGVSIQDNESAIRACLRILGRTRVEAILLTRGEKGALLVDRHSQTAFPALANEVCDATGAGDTVVAVVACCLAAGISLHDASRAAMCAASVSVTKVGVSSVSGDEIQEVLRCYPQTGHQLIAGNCQLDTTVIPLSRYHRQSDDVRSSVASGTTLIVAVNMGGQIEAASRQRRCLEEKASEAYYKNEEKGENGV